MMNWWVLFEGSYTFVGNTINETARTLDKRLGHRLFGNTWVIQIHELRKVANIQCKRPFLNWDIIHHFHILYDWQPAGQTPCLPVGWFAAVKDDRLHLPLPVATPHRLPAKQRVPVCAKRTEARLGWHAPLPETQEPFSSSVCIELRLTFCCSNVICYYTKAILYCRLSTSW